MSKRDKTALTSKQRKMAEKLANPDCTDTVTQLCAEVGVSRATFYRWMDNPSFRDYLNYLIDKYSESELAAVWKALIRRCTGGDTQAMKLFFELKGKYEAKPAGENASELYSALEGED